MPGATANITPAFAALLPEAASWPRSPIAMALPIPLALLANQPAADVLLTTDDVSPFATEFARPAVLRAVPTTWPAVERTASVSMRFAFTLPFAELETEPFAELVTALLGSSAAPIREPLAPELLDVSVAIFPDRVSTERSIRMKPQYRSLCSENAENIRQHHIRRWLRIAKLEVILVTPGNRDRTSR